MRLMSASRIIPLLWKGDALSVCGHHTSILAFTERRRHGRLPLQMSLAHLRAPSVGVFGRETGSVLEGIGCQRVRALQRVRGTRECWTPFRFHLDPSY